MGTTADNWHWYSLDLVRGIKTKITEFSKDLVNEGMVPWLDIISGKLYFIGGESSQIINFDKFGTKKIMELETTYNFKNYPILTKGQLEDTVHVITRESSPTIFRISLKTEEVDEIAVSGLDNIDPDNIVASWDEDSNSIIITDPTANGTELKFNILLTESDDEYIVSKKEQGVYLTEESEFYPETGLKINEEQASTKDSDEGCSCNQMNSKPQKPALFIILMLIAFWGIIRFKMTRTM